jgi:hypothetical protein
MLVQGDTKPAFRVQNKSYSSFPPSFGPSALPEIAIIGSVVSINHGIAFTKSVVITGFPSELVGWLAAFSDPRKCKERQKLRSIKRMRKF